MRSTEQVAKLGEQAAQIVATFPAAWQYVRGHLSDPVAVDQFGLQCATIAAALTLLADRSHGLAEDLIDQED